MPTIMYLLLAPAFVMLVLVGTITPSNGAQPGPQRRKSEGLGVQAIRSIARNFNWGLEEGLEDADAAFIRLFQVQWLGAGVIMMFVA